MSTRNNTICETERLPCAGTRLYPDSMLGALLHTQEKKKTRKRRKETTKRHRKIHSPSPSPSPHVPRRAHVPQDTLIPIPQDPRTRMHECVHTPKHHLLLWQTPQDARRRSLTVFPFPLSVCALVRRAGPHHETTAIGLARRTQGSKSPIPTSVDIDPRCEPHCRSVS